MANVFLSSVIGDPVGTIKEFVAPPNADWLKCDGRVLNKADFPRLAGIMPSLPNPNFVEKGFTYTNSSSATTDVFNGVRFIFSASFSPPYYTSAYQNDQDRPPSSFTGVGSAWSVPVLAANNKAFFVFTGESADFNIGIATCTPTFQANQFANNWTTTGTLTTGVVNGSHAYFLLSSSREIVFRDNQAARAFAYRGNTVFSPNTTNWVEVFWAPVAVSGRNSLVVTANLTLVVANNNATISFKEREFAYWRRASQSVIMRAAEWCPGDGTFIISANNGFMYKATEAQILSGSIGSNTAFAPSTNVVAIAAAGNTVYVAGFNGLLGYSTDAGNSYTVAASNTTLLINQIAAANQTHAVAAGANGVIRFTTNSGATWQAGTSPLANNTTYSSIGFGNGRYYLSSANAQLLESTDNGQTWTAVAPPSNLVSWGNTQFSNVIHIIPNPDTNSVYFISSTTATNIGELFYERKEDLSWNELSLPISNSGGLVFGNRGPTLEVITRTDGIHARIEDVETWEYTFTVPGASDERMQKYVEINEGRGVIAYDWIHQTATGGRIYYSPDRLSWNRRTVSPRMFYVTPSGVTVAMFNQGPQSSATNAITTIAYSLNGGMTWEGATFDTIQIRNLMGWKELVFASVQTPNTSSSDVTLQYSTDYGKNWITAPSSVVGTAFQNQITMYSAWNDELQLNFQSSGAVYTIYPFSYNTQTQFKLPDSSSSTTPISFTHIKAR